jgi:DNA mismatch endonuclease (patch repair protein)
MAGTRHHVPVTSSDSAERTLPVPSSEAVSRRMSVARRRDTAPEMSVRRALHRRGLRYRVDAPLPGMPRRRADLFFTRARVVVFIDGCFWHSCPAHATLPASNRSWWTDKLRRNVERDHDTSARLAEDGYRVLRFWEHEDPAAVADAIEAAVRLRTITRR